MTHSIKNITRVGLGALRPLTTASIAHIVASTMQDCSRAQGDLFEDKLAGDGIWLDIIVAWMVHDSEVEPTKKQSPPWLMTVQLHGSLDVAQVLVVSAHNQ